MATLQNRMIWWSLAAALVIYVVVAHAISGTMEPVAEANLMVGILGLFSVCIAAGSLLWRRRALVDPIQEGRLDPASPDGRIRATQPYVLNMVLCESVGIFGLVLSFLSGKPVFSIVFSGAALVLLYLHRPTAPELEPPLSSLQRATDSTPIT